MQDTTLFCLFVVLLVLPLPVSSESQIFTRGQFKDLLDSNDVTEAMPVQRHVNPNRNTGPNRTPMERIDQESRNKPATYYHDSSHCMNGGTGFLNTFCFCQDEFTGRYCESRINSSCGDVPHGQYVYRNCSLCCCVDGIMECRVHELEGCKKKRDRANFKSIQSNEVSLEIASQSSVPQGSKFGLFSLTLLIYATVWLQSMHVKDLSVR